jgi:hypothetical protein
MTPLECERIFERIEEYKRSIEKYIKDVATLVEKVAIIVDIEEDPWIEPAELEMNEPEREMDMELDEGELDMELDIEAEIFDKGLADFLIETFHTDF